MPSTRKTAAPRYAHRSVPKWIYSVILWWCILTAVLKACGLVLSLSAIECDCSVRGSIRSMSWRGA